MTRFITILALSFGLLLLPGLSAQTRRVQPHATQHQNGGLDALLSDSVTASEIDETDAYTWTGPHIFNTENVGLGVTPTRQLHILGDGQSVEDITDAGNKKGTVYIQASGAATGNGGALVFGSSQGFFGAIKGRLTSGVNNTTGIVDILTRTVNTDTNLTAVARFTASGNLHMPPTATGVARLNIGGSPVAGTQLLRLNGTFDTVGSGTQSIRLLPVSIATTNTSNYTGISFQAISALGNPNASTGGESAILGGFMEMTSTTTATPAFGLDFHLMKPTGATDGKMIGAAFGMHTEVAVTAMNANVHVYCGAFSTITSPVTCGSGIQIEAFDCGYTWPLSYYGSGLANVPATTPTAGMNPSGFFFAPAYESKNSDPADTGIFRLGNTELIAWEAATPGTDLTLGVDASDILQASGSFNSLVLTENNNAVPNATDQLGFFAATTSAQLAGVISNETGTGLLAYATLPTFTRAIITGDSFPVLEVERTSSATTFILSTMEIKANSSGDIVDGFGTRLGFTFEDTGGEFAAVGGVSVVRAGADDTTNIVLENSIAGSLAAKLTVTSAGRMTTVGVQVPPSAASEPEDCATAVLGASYYDTGDNTVCFCLEDGTDTEWVKITDPTHTGHCSI